MLNAIKPGKKITGFYRMQSDLKVQITELGIGIILNSFKSSDTAGVVHEMIFFHFHLFFLTIRDFDSYL